LSVCEQHLNVTSALSTNSLAGHALPELELSNITRRRWLVVRRAVLSPCLRCLSTRAAIDQGRCDIANTAPLRVRIRSCSISRQQQQQRRARDANQRRELVFHARQELTNTTTRLAHVQAYPASASSSVWTRKRVHNGYKRCSCSCACCCSFCRPLYQIFDSLRLCRFSTDRSETFHTY